MKIGIDRNTKNVYKNDSNDYIYLFDEESLEDLLKTKMHCVHWEKCDFVDINLTDYDIDCIKKAKLTDKNWDELAYKNNKIAIIIPNYNYAEYLEKCFNSILNQTYQNFEIIFVDDCSTDKSVEIAKELLKPPHKVIELKQKRYNGGARNEAYLHMSDDVDYVWYVDSDDWVLEDALEKINRKLQSQPDILFVGMDQYKDNKLTTAFTPKYKDKYEAIQGWSGSCGCVVKKKLATKVLYKEGTLKEDKNHHCKLCIEMKTFALLKEPVYVWNRENTKSVTSDRKNIMWKTSTIRHYADTLELYLTEKGKDSRIDTILGNRVEKMKNEIEMGGDCQW